MTNEEWDILNEIEESTNTQADEKTRAGKFIDTVIGIFRKIGKGKVSDILIRVIPILLARVANIEGKVSKLIEILDKKDK